MFRDGIGQHLLFTTLRQKNPSSVGTGFQLNKKQGQIFQTRKKKNSPLFSKSSHPNFQASAYKPK